MKLLILFGVTLLVASSFAQNYTCPDGQVLCEGTVNECIPEEYICDRTFIDCSNDADEKDCPCQGDYFPCPNSLVCVHNSTLCNGIPDCPGGEDEDQECPPCEGFPCKEGGCIPDHWVCDGNKDCAGGEDEDQDCPPCSGFTCDDGHCIPGNWICDGDRDCCGLTNISDDGSDEANCTMAAVPANPFKGHSMMANAREVKIRKLNTLAALSKRKIKRTQNKIREERSLRVPTAAKENRGNDFLDV